MVGEYIRSLRASAGLNQRELAERMAISASMLSLIEAGHREPTIRFLKDAAKALQIPSASLFALALSEDSCEGDVTPYSTALRKTTESLLAAIQHSLVLQRLKHLREHA